MPDFDVDFCMEGRDRVIAACRRIVRPRSGIADHHLWYAWRRKAVVRDVARVQGKPYMRLADKLKSKLDSLRARHDAERRRLRRSLQLGEFVDSDEEAQEIMEMALQARGHHSQCRQACGWRGNRADQADGLSRRCTADEAGQGLRYPVR